MSTKFLFYLFVKIKTECIVFKCSFINFLNTSYLKKASYGFAPKPLAKEVQGNEICIARKSIGIFSETR